MCCLHNITSELEVQMRFSVIPPPPKGSLPSDSVVLCVAPGVSQLPELAGDHKHDRKNESGYLEHLNREGQFLHEWSVYHCFTLLCSLLLQHFTSLHFWRWDLLLSHTYGRHFNYNHAPQSYCNANNISHFKSRWGAVVYEPDIQFRAPISIQE